MISILVCGHQWAATIHIYLEISQASYHRLREPLGRNKVVNSNNISGHLVFFRADQWAATIHIFWIISQASYHPLREPMGRNKVILINNLWGILYSFARTNGPQLQKKKHPIIVYANQWAAMYLSPTFSHASSIWFARTNGPDSQNVFTLFFLHIIYILVGGTTGRNNVHGGKTLHMHSFAIDQCAIAKPSVFSNFKRMMYWFPRTSGPQQCLYDPQFNMHHFDATSHFHQKFNFKKKHKNTHAKNLSSLSCF